MNSSFRKGRFGSTVAEILKAVDRDVERGENILMLGFGIVMMSTFFAPFVPPKILLPLVAIAFAFSAGFARVHYRRMHRELAFALERLDERDKALLLPISSVFETFPMPPLVESFNPLKNLPRTGKSIAGGLLTNPLWMPIFYTMGMQIKEEKNLILLNTAVVGIEQRNSALYTLWV